MAQFIDLEIKIKVNMQENNINKKIKKFSGRQLIYDKDKDVNEEGEEINVQNPIKENNIIFNMLKIEEKDKIILKNSLKFVDNSIDPPTTIYWNSLEELFNIIPEVNSNENLKFLFSILFAEICRLNGNIVYQKNLLESAQQQVSKKFGKYNILNLPITIALGTAYKELGLVNKAYECLDTALKNSYLNTKFDSLETIEVIKQFILFSNHIGENIEEGIYCEIAGNLAIKKLKKLYGNLDKFESYSYNEKFYCLILINYIMQHLNHLSNTKKVKDLKYISKKFKEYDQLLNKINILKENKFQFENIFNENDVQEITKYSYNSIYLYLHPEIKLFIDPIIYKKQKNCKNI